MKKLVLASGNAGKLREFGQLLAPFDFEVLPQSAFNVPEADEPHITFVENAIAKARHAAHLTGLPALADDSGLCVDAPWAVRRACIRRAMAANRSRMRRTMQNCWPISPALPTAAPTMSPCWC